MSDQPDPTLDDCECCEVEPPEQPIFNPPGQPALQYRIDIQPTFLQRMIDALPHETAAAEQPRPLGPSAAGVADRARSPTTRASPCSTPGRPWPTC